MERCHEARAAEGTRPTRTNREQAGTEFGRPGDERRQTGGASNGSGAARSRDAGETERALHASLVDRIGAGPAGRYFGDQTRLRFERDGLTVRVANRFLADQIERRFAGTLEELATAHGAGRVTIETAATPAESAPARAERAPVSRGPQASRRPSLPAHHRFESFVVGRSNEVAFEASRRFARGDCPDPLLLIHGPCGVGKTHLLHAIATEFRAGLPAARVRVTDSERYISEYVASVRNGTMGEFRRRHNELDLLCLDDVHNIAGKAKSQHELVQTLRALTAASARIALVSDEPPSSVESLHAGLRSRLSGGLVVRLDAPEAGLRARIARAVSDRRRLPMDDEACRVLAEGSVRIGGVTGGVRELEGLVAQTEAIWRFEGGGVGSIGIETAARAVAARGGGATEPARLGPLSVRDIIHAACSELGVEPAEFTGRTRVRRVVLARSLAVLVARLHTNLSYPEIARAMRRSNHSTVITQHNTIERQAREGRAIEAACAYDGLSIEQAADRLASVARRRHAS
ncbi:MAG: DnaA ATPase domain-containing protein [Phycisphaerales bacterium JB040]